MTEPITLSALITELTEFIKDTGIEAALDYAKKRRALNFFSTLKSELEKEKTSTVETTKVDSILRKLVSTEIGREVIFDAYRRVSLAASRELGPKIIAILTHKLLKEGRLANEDEERMFNGAEVLSDKDLRWFAVTFPQNGKATGLRFHASETLKHRKNQIAILTTQPRQDFSFTAYKLQIAHIVQIEELGPLDEPEKRQKVMFTTPSMQEFVEIINRATGPASAML